MGRPESVYERFKKAYAVFRNNRDPTERVDQNYFPDRMVQISASPQDRTWITEETRGSIANPVFNRISIDCANAEIKHIRLDEQGRYIEDMPSPLNECLTLSANDDQVGFALIQDAVYTMLDHGHVAIIPELTEKDPELSDGVNIYSLRVGVVTTWSPNHVRVRMYNSHVGRTEETVLPKSTIAIIQNPFYSVMNDRNATFERLKHKMALLDRSDDRFMDGKLDLIIQLPYLTRSELQKDRADKRLEQIVDQLKTSEYGIAYTDDTEKITQLNRPLENTLADKVAKLRAEFFAEIGFAESILNGTATPDEKVSYNNKIIKPILRVLTTEMTRKFLSPTARSDAYRQRIAYFVDPFGLATPEQLATLGDTYLRNEVLTPNEYRQKLGFKPSGNPDSDVLRNRNMPMQDEGLGPQMMNNYDNNQQLQELIGMGFQPDEANYLIAHPELMNQLTNQDNTPTTTDEDIQSLGLTPEETAYLEQHPELVGEVTKNPSMEAGQNG